MAKTIDAFSEEVLSTTCKQDSPAPSMKSVAKHVVALFRSDPEIEVETFIRQRGGIMSDGIERELSRHFGRM